MSGFNAKAVTIAMVLFICISLIQAQDPDVLSELPRRTDRCRCGPRETYSPCQSHCEIRCLDLPEAQRPCPRICVPGCACDYERGYVRNAEGICIPKEQCSQVQDFNRYVEALLPRRPGRCRCGPREAHRACDAHCEVRCQDLPEAERPCPKICIRGCACDYDRGYVRNDDGICIPKEECMVQ